MSIERELFQKEYCKVQMITDKGDTFEQYPNGDYVRHSLQLAWLMWQASANREGYKLVPVEPCEKTLNEIKEKHWDMRGVQLCRSDYNDLYKAMIGVIK